MLDLVVTLPVVPGGTDVSGTAVEADGDVQVGVHVDGVEPVTAVFSSATEWSATLADPLEFGMGGSAWQHGSDVDGDRTEVWWSTSNTSFSVDPFGDQVWGGEWAPDSPMTVSVTAPVVAGPWYATSDSEGNFHLDLAAEGYDVAAGETVLVSDGTGFSKEHVVTELVWTGVDVDTDTVSGTAAVDSTVWVNVHESGADDVEATATGGTWDAVMPMGIDEGTQGYAYQPDDDGDQT